MVNMMQPCASAHSGQERASRLSPSPPPSLPSAASGEGRQVGGDDEWRRASSSAGGAAASMVTSSGASWPAGVLPCSRRTERAAESAAANTRRTQEGECHTLHDTMRPNAPKCSSMSPSVRLPAGQPATSTAAAIVRAPAVHLLCARTRASKMQMQFLIV